ncbi:MAG: succinylglutamate desuccinylase/aspartoacylase family protein [Desulfobacterales bacterium]|jgi:succinylglutamate desuccinylase
MNIDESREKILDYFSENNNCELPYCIQVKAEREGEHVVVVGGTHGNEPAGVNAMVGFHRRLKDGEIKLKSGKVSLLLGNPQAYEKDRRYVDRDLNRSFCDPDDATLEERRAGEIIAYLDCNNDIAALLDLHSVSIGDFKICVYEKDNTQSLNLALSISDIPLHFAYHPDHMPGTLIQAAGTHQICSLIVECGNHLSRSATHMALDLIYSILVHKKLIDASLWSEKKMTGTITQYESIQPIKPGANFRFIIEALETGTKLEKGQQFAIDDDRIHIAPQDCHVVVPSMIVKPTDVDAGFLGKKNLI